MKKYPLIFLLICLSYTGCDKDPITVPHLDLSKNQIDILFVSESEGVQQIYTVQDTALNQVWGISLPYDRPSAGFLDPAWSNDPRKFVFSNIEKVFYPYAPLLSNIYILNMNNDTMPSIIRITADSLRIDSSGIVYDALNFRPDWSRDGRSLIYISNRIDRFEIYQLYLDDTLGQISPHRKLTDTSDMLNVYCYPSFSPDGRKILYTSSATGKEEIWIMDSNGTNKTRITNTGATKTRRPRFSPDGNTISFYSNCWIRGTDSLQIYTTNITGTRIDTVTRSGNCYDPAWKYDGQQIVYAKNTKPNKGYIYIINPDGTNEARLIPENKSYYPAWRPSR